MHVIAIIIYLLLWYIFTRATVFGSFPGVYEWVEVKLYILLSFALWEFGCISVHFISANFKLFLKADCNEFFFLFFLF